MKRFTFNFCTLCLGLFGAWNVLLSRVSGAEGDPRQIQPASDAPKPLTPEASLTRFSLPPGFRMELLASEPLIFEPSGVCWDERGRLYVSELHGYNLEGHYDVEALNRTGVLDREVRRIQANPDAKEKALSGTYGTVKRLEDLDGDGRMDRASVLADHLPPCYGLVAARKGVIVAAAPDILYLADLDDDGYAEIREVLFTGFAVGALERGINSPQWGLDHWIYFGSGHGGGTITGPHLPEPVVLGRTNFRIRADGTAIEPVLGSTGTFGHAFSPDGDYFVIGTSHPGYGVAPIPWKYLVRNPDAPSFRGEYRAGDYAEVFPTSAPHPWRKRREEDPGFFQYYRDRYGVSDSTASGYFTSACSPLVYQDTAFPKEFHGSYWVCEPSQNLVHLAEIARNGNRVQLQRPESFRNSEFLTSSEVWFHPMNLVHAPDGSLVVVDFYREIIEDYSAVPRYLQQQYGLIEGIRHGRLWRLSHVTMESPMNPEPFPSAPEHWVAELGSEHLWRRQTARRLILENSNPRWISDVKEALSSMATKEAFLNALHTLEALQGVGTSEILQALNHPDGAVRVHGLRLADLWINKSKEIRSLAWNLLKDPEPRVRIQAALTFGELEDPEGRVEALSLIGIEFGNEAWVPEAVMSSAYGIEIELLRHLLMQEDLKQVREILLRLGQTIATANHPENWATALELVSKADQAVIQEAVLEGFTKVFGSRQPPAPLLQRGYDALNQLSISASQGVSTLTGTLLERFLAVDPVQGERMSLEMAERAMNRVLSPEERKLAIEWLSRSASVSSFQGLLNAWKHNTPALQRLILEGVFRRQNHLEAFIQKLESEEIPWSVLDAYQRWALMNHSSERVRQGAQNLAQSTGRDWEGIFKQFQVVFTLKGDVPSGEEKFREHCSTCHQVRGIGFEVGPDLMSEFQRSEEAILRDILAPNDNLTAGYSTFKIETIAGETFLGILSEESPNGYTLRMPAGQELTLPRGQVRSAESLPLSLMPEGLKETLQPQDIADVLSWLKAGRNGPSHKSGVTVLLDENASMVEALTQGGGKVSWSEKGSFQGNGHLELQPFQRYSTRIPGWQYPIREFPKEGEYRFLKMTWKAPGAKGIMMELADQGQWPNAKVAKRRYYSGDNTTEWNAIQVSSDTPQEWVTVILDLWRDNGDFILTGWAPTALGGTAHFDGIELWSHWVEL